MILPKLRWRLILALEGNGRAVTAVTIRRSRLMLFSHNSLKLSLITAWFVLYLPADVLLAVQNFKSWQAACRELTCATETLSRSGDARLRISRMPGKSAPWHVSLLGLEVEPDKDAKISFWVNGRRTLLLASSTGLQSSVGNHFLADADALAALFLGLRHGRRLAVTYARSGGGRSTLSFSLNGLDEALAWVDTQQRRAGSAQSVSAPGNSGRLLMQLSQGDTDSSENQASAVPQIISEAHATDSACDLPARLPQIYREGIVRSNLDAVNTLFLLPCSSGAYATTFRVFVFDSRYPQDVRPEYFAAYSNKRGWYGKPDLINANYDADTKTITANEVARGIGDCGSQARYRWTADGLRLLSYRYWRKCDGTRMADEWPVIFDYDKDIQR